MLEAVDVVLDAIMHSDVEPFYPLSQENGLLGIMTISQLHQFCIYTGLVGAAVYYLVEYARKKHNNN